MNSLPHFSRRAAPRALPAALSLLAALVPLSAPAKGGGFKLPAQQAASAQAKGAEWSARLSRDPLGAHPPLPLPYRATYRIGWSGVTAAHADISILSGRGGETIELRGRVATEGTARNLFPLDAKLSATTDARTLRPRHVEQEEERREKWVGVTADFSEAGVRRVETITPRATKVAEEKRKSYPWSDARDFLSAYLYLRSLEWKDGDSRAVLVMSPTAPYFLRATLRGREDVTTKLGKRRALRLSVDELAKVQDSGALKPQRKMKSTTVWISDDPARRLLRIEAKVFIGAMFLELESESGGG